MSIETLLEQLRERPGTVEFEMVMATIKENYAYTPTAFVNGDIDNAAGSNEGSCQIFAFAQLHGLDEQTTLACFGRYYREDVLNNPAGTDHANIRNFMRHGWGGVRFQGVALRARR